MKKFIRISIFLVLAVILATGQIIPASANDSTINAKTLVSRDDAPEAVKNEVSKLISFYGGGYRADLGNSINNLEMLSSEYHNMWSDIVEYWDWIEYDMVENIGVAPDGISSHDKHVFIVLGFALNNDGTMTDELIGRLEVAKASADKYPESYVLVTGGVEKNGWTEGERMHDWLVENGVSTERIIVEQKAPDTAGNATNSFEMLYKDYDVDSVSLISTQYHVKRGSILYYAESILKAFELGVEPIKFIGEANAGWYRADKTTEPLSLKASSLRLVARVPNINISDELTEIQGLKISGKTEYIQGESLDLEVHSIDSKNYHADLTKFTKINGYDPNRIGKQSINLSYIQGDKAYTENFEITVMATPNEDISRGKLQNLVSANEARDLDMYTLNSRGYFLRILGEAKEVLNNNNATKDEYIKAYNLLNAATQKLTILENVAKKKEVVASHNQAEAYKITDEVVTTDNYWTSIENGVNVPTEDSFFTIDLGGLFNVESIRAFPYWGGLRVYQYEIHVSDNNEDWTKVVDFQEVDYMTDKGNHHLLDEPVETRFIKVVGLKTYVQGRPDINNFHMIETQVFGTVVDNELKEAINELNSLISTVDSLAESGYGKTSWSTLQRQLAVAKETLDNNPTHTEVIEAYRNLENAVNSLEEKISGMLESYELTLGEILTLNPTPSNGKWEYDTDYLSLVEGDSTLNSGIQLKAVKQGSTKVLYITESGEETTVLVTITGKTEDVIETEDDKKLPNTGINSYYAFTTGFAVVILGFYVITIERKRIKTN